MGRVPGQREDPLRDGCRPERPAGERLLPQPQGSLQVWAGAAVAVRLTRVQLWGQPVPENIAAWLAERQNRAEKSEQAAEVTVNRRADSDSQGRRHAARKLLGDLATLLAHVCERALLALRDASALSYGHGIAQAFAGLGLLVFA
ncbi:hypothetical protein GCM10010840_28730 [Deinococcus aerolatus]|uniref:Uncharacterized protein n=1 Tax=Deinococcus aerolatus TaxID=522487 RepID=A0ABQ2GER6_9DEIO|nr:hypothetical protein GCM10010840_28730 [Deinococcus aerolatus]